MPATAERVGDGGRSAGGLLALSSRALYGIKELFRARSLFRRSVRRWRQLDAHPLHVGKGVDFRVNPPWTSSKETVFPVPVANIPT
jgi:hypothetical protein